MKEEADPSLLTPVPPPRVDSVVPPRPMTDVEEWNAAMQEARKVTEQQTKSDDRTAKSTKLSDDDAVKTILQTLEELRGPAREAAFVKIAERVKLKIVGEQYTMGNLIRDAIAAKAMPEVHLVIRDECIRLGVGRREYRAVVVPLFNRIRDAIGWKDRRGITFCPKWQQMKRMCYAEYKSGPNKGIHIVKPDWKNREEGCVWTEVDVYLAERLIAYRMELPAAYRTHLKTIVTRVEQVEEMCPGRSRYILIICVDGVHGWCVCGWCICLCA